MKKLVALSLVVVLLMSMAAFASADSGKASILSQLDVSQSTMMGNKAYACALVLTDYILINSSEASSILEQVASSGNGYIAAYGSSVDIYLRCTDGKYLNLFVTFGSDVQIMDFGKSSGYSTTNGYTYYPVSMSDVSSSFMEILEILAN